MPDGNNNNEAGSDWKIWAIKVAYGIIGLLIAGMAYLAVLSYDNLKASQKVNSEVLQKDLARLENALKDHTKNQTDIAIRQDTKFDDLCKKVGDQGVIIREHDILLRWPWPQRKEFYLQKNREVRP